MTMTGGARFGKQFASDPGAIAFPFIWQLLHQQQTWHLLQIATMGRVQRGPLFQVRSTSKLSRRPLPVLGKLSVLSSISLQVICQLSCFDVAYLSC